MAKLLVLPLRLVYSIWHVHGPAGSASRKLIEYWRMRLVTAPY